MPTGLVIMRWNERQGAQLIGRYPAEIQITEKTLMQIYSAHEYSEEAGMVSLTVGAVNIASYCTGSKSGFYINLLLNVGEDPDVYEDGLAETARIILGSLDNDGFLKLLPSLFQRLAVYPSLMPEQKLAVIYADEVKRMVLKRLQEECVLFKSEIAIWLKDVYKKGFIDIESITTSLIKEGLIKEATVKGVQSELVFLVNDVVITRKPPTLLLREGTHRGLPSFLEKEYEKEVQLFFSQYTSSEADLVALVEMLTDPGVYETLTLLRNAIATRDDLEKLKKKGVDDVDRVLKALFENKMLVILRDDKGNAYHALKSDVLVQKIYPGYLLNTIRKNYKEKSKANAVLIEYLNILEETYNSSLVSVKQKSDKKSVKAK